MNARARVSLSCFICLHWTPTPRQSPPSFFPSVLSVFLDVIFSLKSAKASLLSTLYSFLSPMRPIYNMFAREAVSFEKYFATFLRKDLHGSQNRRTFAPAKRERPLRGKA